MQKNWNGILYIPDKNPSIDALAKHKVRQDVWYRLDSLFPLIKANPVWDARRNGCIGALINSDKRFESIRNPLGPQNKEEWILLAQACIEAMYDVVDVTEEQLEQYKYFPYKPCRIRQKKTFEQLIQEHQ